MRTITSHLGGNGEEDVKGCSLEIPTCGMLINMYIVFGSLASLHSDVDIVTK